MTKNTISKFILSVSTLLLLLFSLTSSYAQTTDDNTIPLYIFYGQGCSHCEKALEFLQTEKELYPNLLISKHEVYFNATERELLENLSKAYGKELGGVPTIFINDEVIIGFSDSIAKTIDKKIKDCSEKGCESPLNKKNIEQDNTLTKDLTIPAVILAALVDAINPCAFAVLILLMSTVLISRNRKKALLSGFAFSASIFISYFLMGLGLYSAIQAAGLSHSFYFVVAILAIIIGLFNLKDYLWYGKWFVMEVPRKWRPKMKSLIQGVTSIPGAFGIGFLVSMFLLPCTSGPYIVILGLLAKSTTQNYAILLLLLYNFIFVLPMILITLGIYFGYTTTDKAEKLRKNRLRTLHLIAGIIILLLGVGMLVAMMLGMM
ncbi:MAG: cytochrome c biogenesis protein [Nanoarchaeota archaeon]|nr:cytochrome c biogenesis protein [Nanoarchaeota archaeon]